MTEKSIWGTDEDLCRHFDEQFDRDAFRQQMMCQPILVTADPNCPKCKGEGYEIKRTPDWQILRGREPEEWQDACRCTLDWR